MAYDNLRNSSLAQSLTDVFADFSDLIQKEIRLAKAEVSDKLLSKLNAGLWMGVAGVLGLIAVLFVLQGIVFGIASLGLALHWSCLIVAAVIAIAAATCFFLGRAKANEDLMPGRTVRQVSRDIKVAKEQLT
jgi:hypothetical protein